MYYDPIYENEAIYIAGPECFYTNGYPHWHALAARARMFGCQVTMPNDSSLALGNPDPRKDADAIFANCAKSIRSSTAIIADLEFYRGPDVDGGTIFELGMAYAGGCRCYGYTRDLRETRFKYQGSRLEGDKIYDRKGRELPFACLPFSANVVSACRIVEGDFDDALHLLSLDITEERKQGIYPPRREALASISHAGKPIAYLAGPTRYDADAAEKYTQMKAICADYGLQAISPLDNMDIAEEECVDAYARAFRTFQRNLRHVQICDVLIADLNDFHAWEPDADTSFECGAAYCLGKPMLGYMDDARRMIERIPNRGPSHEYRDQCGCNAENFDYPINCMFASSMPVFEGSFEMVMTQAVSYLSSIGVQGGK